jgi:TRAP-type transport system periplasmic protein
MKKIVLITMGILAASAASAQTTAPEVTLRFNRWVPPTHHFHARILAPWAERVEKASQGRIKIEFTAASLGAPPRQFDLAGTGVADITAGNQTYTPERFVASRMAELPFLGDTAESLSVAQWRVHEKYLARANEYKGTRLLTVFNNGPYQIFTAKKAIVQAGDLKSLKMRAAGGMPTDIAKALEVVPVATPITEAYESLSRGIVEGTFLPPDSVRSFQLDKFLEHQIKIPRGLFNAAFFVVINEKKFDSLSSANQAAVLSVSGEGFARIAGQIWDDQDRIANEQFAKSGMKITAASPALLADLSKRLSHIEDAWIKEASARGIDARAALDMFRREAAEYKRPN